MVDMKRITLFSIMALIVIAGCCALHPGEVHAQRAEPSPFAISRNDRASDASWNAVSIRANDEPFSMVGFLFGGAIGAVVGGFLGYHIDRHFGFSGGDDPGIGGLLIGATVGGVAGAIWGGERGP